MKGSLLFLALVLAYVSANDGGLKVKFSVGLHPGRDFFWDMPKNITSADAEGWAAATRPNGPRASLVLYCPGDRVLCGYFDDNGFIAGLQINLDQDQFTNNTFDMKTQGFVEWAPTANSSDTKKYWSIRQYFVSEEYLLTDPDERAANYNTSKTLQQDAAWVDAFNGTVDKIPVTLAGLSDTLFTKQSCIPWMGRHYYYNMSSTTECTSSTIYPWFLLESSGEIAGISFNTFGVLPIVSGVRNWFERPSRPGVKITVPYAPTCFLDLAVKPGRMTMHIYFKKKPWYMFCLND